MAAILLTSDFDMEAKPLLEVPTPEFPLPEPEPEEPPRPKLLPPELPPLPELPEFPRPDDDLRPPP